MNQEEAAHKALLELQQRVPLTLTHKVLIKYYFALMYGIGFDEGKRQNYHLRRPVFQIKNGRIVARFESLTEAAEVMKVDSSAIGKGIKRKCNIGGFKWRYVKPRYQKHGNK